MPIINGRRLRLERRFLTRGKADWLELLVGNQKKDFYKCSTWNNLKKMPYLRACSVMN